MKVTGDMMRLNETYAECAIHSGIFLIVFDYVPVRTPNGDDNGKDLFHQHYLRHQHQA